jgi:pilus assembly protein CpaC
MNTPFRNAAAALSLLAFLSPSVSLHGQAPPAPPAIRSDAAERILLTAGRSMVVTTDFDITRIAVTNPAIADAVVVKPREVLVDGKGAGTVSLIIWGGETRKQYDVIVDSGVSLLQQNFDDLFRGEDINVSVTENSVILSGSVSNNDVMLRAAEIARAAFPKSSVVNMLQLPGGSPSNQVMLQVRFAEVNRNAFLQAGLNLFANHQEFVARSTTQQFAAPDVDNQQPDLDILKFTDFLNLFFFHKGSGIGGVLKALQGRGQLQSLAEPNLIAYNGQEASFLAGGEVPVPVVQGLTGNISVIYKEFGVRLNFTPTIAGDVIRLKLRPEVSTLDFQNGIILSGFRIPALNTRRAETDVELRDGQSFAIAGLMNNTSQADSQAIPILSKLPIIGALFKSKADRAEQTELLVIVTPHLVRPLDPDEVPALPTDPGKFIKPKEGEDVGSQLTDAPPPSAKPVVPGAVKKPSQKK